jgi:hypothetical protein
MTDRERPLDELRPVAFAIAVSMHSNGIGVLALEIAGGQITSISSIVNPDKLTHLGRVGDFNSLLRSVR